MNTDDLWIIATQIFKPGSGQGRPCYELARRIASQGNRVILVGNEFANDLTQIPGIEFVHHDRPLRSALLGDFYLDRMTQRAVQAKGLDRLSLPIVGMGGGTPMATINWVHFLHSSWYPKYTPWWTLHGAKHRLNNRLQIWRERRALRAAQFVIANSNGTREEIIRRIGLNPTRVFSVYYGTDQTEVPPVTPVERQLAREHFQLDPDVPVVSFVAGLGTDHRKGFDSLINAWAIRYKRLGERAGVVLAAGQGNLAYWQAKIDSAGLNSSIRLLGYRKDVTTILAASDLMVSPTRYEPYGLNVHEALCRHIPAIVTRETGVGERYPETLENWLLNDPNDHVELERAISLVLDDPTAPEKYGTALTEFARELRLRSWSDMADDIMNIWQNRDL